MNGAQYIVKFLEDKGVDLVFGYPGGSVIFFYDVLGRSSIKHILTRHEQGAVHAADGYARVTGRPGVCIATSGPGATNLVTGLANAYLDSIPIIAFTGQASTASIGRDSFQEADITGITMPITKHNYLVKELAELPAVLEEAWQVAIAGRPGPVLIDIPKDIFMGKADFTVASNIQPTRKVPLKNGLGEQIAKVVGALKTAEKPLLFVGGGVISSEASPELEEFIEQYQMPVVTSLMGKGVISDEQKEVLGMVGMHGKPAANLALSSCDLLLSVGVRFSDRVTGKPEEFLPHTPIIHVDIDPAELSKNVKTAIPVVCDAKKFFRELMKRLREEKMDFQLEEWYQQISLWQKTYPLSYEKTGSLKPQHIIQESSLQAGGQGIIVTDVGQHQMFVAQYFPVKQNRSFVSSGGLGTMGFGLPAAVGAAFGRDEMVILFTGDGGIQMNLQELAVIAKYQLSVKIFLMNNSCLGMVRQWQELFFDKHYAHTLLDSGPDFMKIADAYGIKGLRLTKTEDVQDIVKETFETKGPVLVECVIDPEENVFPIVPPGGQPHEMLGRWQGEKHISSIS